MKVALGDSCAIDFGGAAPASTKGTCHNVAQGTGYDTRIGDRIVLKSVHFRGKFFVHTDALPEMKTNGYYYTPTVRAIVVLDKQNQKRGPGSAPFLDVFNPEVDTGGTTPGGGESSLIFRNLKNTSRYVILSDKLITLTPPTMMGVVSSLGQSTQGSAPIDTTLTACIKEHNYKLNLTNLDIPVQYDRAATDGDASNIIDNNVFMMLISTASHCGYKMNCRARYVDA